MPAAGAENPGNFTTMLPVPNQRLSIAPFGHPLQSNAAAGALAVHGQAPRAYRRLLAAQVAALAGHLLVVINEYRCGRA